MKIPVELWIFISTLYRNKHIYGLFIACRKKACSSSPAPPLSFAGLATEQSLITRCLCTSNRCSPATENQCLAWSYIVFVDCTEHTYLKSNALCRCIYLSHNKEQVPTSSYGSPLLSFHSNVFYRCLQMNFRLNSLCFWTIRKYDMLSVWYLVIKFWLKSS